MSFLTVGDESKKFHPEVPRLNITEGINNRTYVLLDDQQIYQSIKGFGAALTNSAAYLIATHSAKDDILNDLFTPEGLDISYLRIPIGGSDFQALPPFTYNDVNAGAGPDFELSYFNINKDRLFTIPLMKEILKKNPKMQFMATPWSAPAWMKSNHTLNGGNLIDEEMYMRSYANYFVKFIMAFAEEGLHFDTLTVQNEPHHETTEYPSMRMAWTQQSTFIREFLGPALLQSNIKTQILIWDHNFDEYWYPNAILDDQNTRVFVAGSAFHCYAGAHTEPMKVHLAHPDKDIYFTECSGGEWDPNFNSSFNWNVKNIFIGQLDNWARTALLWNLALDPSHGPKSYVGGCTNCRGVITTQFDGLTYTRELEYYVIGHFSRAVKPEAKRIAVNVMSTSDEIVAVAFRNADGSTAVIVQNNHDHDFSDVLTIQFEHRVFEYDPLPPKSVLTLQFDIPCIVVPQSGATYIFLHALLKILPAVMSLALVTGQY